MTQTPPLFRSITDIRTPEARRYVVQLCKHFHHKRAVTLEDGAGSIQFPSGLCRASATDDTLTLSVESADETQVPQLQDVVARHLLRFSFREDLSIVWRADASPPL